MEEKIIRQSEAGYFKSATKLFNGYLILTDTRISFMGEHARIKMNHGALGNIVRDKVEKKMGYDQPEQCQIDILLSELKYEVKRFGFTKRLILTDKDGQVYKTQITKKSERAEWPDLIEQAIQNLSK